MENQFHAAIPSTPQVKATLRLGSEVYSVNATKGTLSDKLVAMKEESMGIMKDFITKHNVPNDVPDEPIEGSSDDETAKTVKLPGKSKKRK